MRGIILLISIAFIGISSPLFSQKRQFKQKKGTHRYMTYNIKHGEGMDDVIDIGRLAGLIGEVNPEVVALQEVDSVAGRSHNIDIMQELGYKLDMYANFAAAIPLRKGKYGVGILSKEKPLRVKKQILPGREEARVLLVTEFRDYVFCCTHFSLTEDDRKESIRIINDIVSSYDKPVLLAGDLNFTPDSEEMKLLLAKWDLLSSPKSKTFPSDRPEEVLDYIFCYKAHSKGVEKYRSHVIMEKVISDHRPLFVDVRLK